MWEVRCGVCPSGRFAVVKVDDLDKWIEQRIRSGALTVVVHAGYVMYYSGRNRLSFKKVV